MSSLIELKNLSLNFAELKVLNEVSLNVEAGERLAIVGLSGCGKSSLLSLMAGLVFPSKGQVSFAGQPVLGPSPRRAILFQNHALFPWLTAAQNIEFVLRAQGRPLGQAKALLKRFDLGDFANAYPRQLSGGMQQRVGIARALACEPDILLLDEPFSALDGLTRDLLLEDLLPRLKCAVVLVTHSIEEALFVGSRVIVLSGRPGRIAGEFRFTDKKPGCVIDMKRSEEYLRLETAIYERMKGVRDEISHRPELDARF